MNAFHFLKLFDWRRRQAIAMKFHVARRRGAKTPEVLVKDVIQNAKDAIAACDVKKAEFEKLIDEIAKDGPAAKAFAERVLEWGDLPEEERERRRELARDWAIRQWRSADAEEEAEWEALIYGGDSQEVPGAGPAGKERPPTESEVDGGGEPGRKGDL
jgi:hypothetical protein